MFTNLKVERSVYEVTDKSPFYRELRPHKTQRIVKSSHLSNLIESYKNKGSALKDVPILVDRYGKIRDGHHRYLAATALGIPYYIMEVSTITGHKDLKMLKRYTHLKAEDLALKLG